LEAVEARWHLPVLVTTHPRTRKRLEALGYQPGGNILFHEPFGFYDYNKLQLAAKCVLSDSGTISEESSLLGFPAVTLRESIERPEALDTGAIVMTGLDAEIVVDAIGLRLDSPHAAIATLPAGYEVLDTSERVTRFVLSTARANSHWWGLHG
jgi:UDP-N-acetylglucosamine 2-epimerase (non-hydrolysing)